MRKYTFQNTLINKKELRQLLGWSFSTYGSIIACCLADELKNLGFKYASQAGISISIEDLRIPEVKNSILKNAQQEILNTEKFCLKGKITEVERYQKIIDTWNITSELLKDEVVQFFKKYDPLNSVFIMAFSGARGNLSQVRQLIGMRGLMSDPSGQIMNLPIKKNFREGLTITDYLMSGYGARKGIVDTALKTANSGYLTRRLIDVAQDIIIREKDCLTTHSLLFNILNTKSKPNFSKIIGHLIDKPIYEPKTNKLITEINTQITPELIQRLQYYKIQQIYIRSPLTCKLYRSICQKCYGWDLSTENLVDMGEAVGIIAGQSIGEPGTQLTMRTFHTGGIFTSEANQQIIGSINGVIKFSKLLNTTSIRTNRGENVLVTENSGFLSLIPNNQTKKNLQIDLPRNTILFVNDQQYIKKKTIIGQFAGAMKQVRTETKQVISNISGEIYIPPKTTNINLTTENKLLWILSGKFYKAPRKSFLNFYPDYKINKNNFIFRSKVINYQSGFIQTNFIKTSFLQNEFKVVKNILVCKRSQVQKLSFPIENQKYLIIFNKLCYITKFKSDNLTIDIKKSFCPGFAKLLSKKFFTETGGTPYYDTKLFNKHYNYLKKDICYLNSSDKIHYRTVIWLSEEIYTTNSDNSFLIIKKDNFIPKHTEIIPNVFSKTSGVLLNSRKKTSTQEISINPGLVFKINKISDIKNTHNQLFFPGEFILNTIKVYQLSLCQLIETSSSIRILIRPINIYEVPFPKVFKTLVNINSKNNNNINLKSNIYYVYHSGKKIRNCKKIEIIKQSLDLELKKFIKRNASLTLKIFRNHKNTDLRFFLNEKILLEEYIPSNLKYTGISSCQLIENNQFIDRYSIFGFLESYTKKSLNLIKFKSKQQTTKQVFLISNDDCLIFQKNKINKNSITDLVNKDENIKEIGKILISNDKYLTIQKGQPYFFPNCKNNKFVDNNNLKYKIVNSKNSLFDCYNRKNIHFTYSNITDKYSETIRLEQYSEKLSFSKLLMKKKGRYYSSGIPILVREFLINQNNNSQTKLSGIDKRPWFGYFDYKETIYKTKKYKSISHLNRIRLKNGFLMFMKNSQLTKNDIRSDSEFANELASVILLEHPFRSLTIHSVTEDYFEKEVNSVYCKNGDFIENNQTIGLLNFEKEITGDIVQGLPRVEELLEARKKKRISKHTPKNKKKSLLIRKTTIDASFQFRKLATTIKENEKINPHSLLKLYFNYFARIKELKSQNNNIIKLYKLSDNYEASYKSFKKVQLLILNLVQLVYESQGVSIANKHLEVIIKQMTTKVLITHEGNTPLLPREVIDLYHINYINDIVKNQQKNLSYYVPLLLGITKAALNNPSFISAASFQETTKVLTKAALEGRLDWLRGLKENIIIGHLIPSGTGYKNYINSFKRNTNYLSKVNFKLKKNLN